MTVQDLMEYCEDLIDNGYGELEVHTSDIDYGYCPAETPEVRKNDKETFVLIPSYKR